MNILKRIFIVMFLFLLLGCGCSSDYKISAKNDSGVELNNVRIESSGKKFKYGNLLNGGKAGFANANTLFGRNPPKSITIHFTPQGGKPKIIEKVAIPKLGSERSIVLTIDKKYKATAVCN